MNKCGESMLVASLFKEVFYQSRIPQLVMTLDETKVY
jgi:two-component system, sporulation sensor kinase A